MESTFLPIHQPSTTRLLPTHLPTPYVLDKLPPYLPSQLSAHLLTYLRIYLPNKLPTYIPTYLPTHLHIYLSLTNLTSFLPTYLPIPLPTHSPYISPPYLPSYLFSRGMSSHRKWNGDVLRFVVNLAAYISRRASLRLGSPWRMRTCPRRFARACLFQVGRSHNVVLKQTREPHVLSWSLTTKIPS